MASLAEVQSIWSNDKLKAKVEAALTILAEEVRVESDQTAGHAERAALAARALADPTSLSARFIRAMVAQNASQPIAAINNIANAADETGDGAIKTGVRNAWNVIALSGT